MDPEGPEYIKNRLCDSGRQLLVEKASAVVVGITLKNVITVTVVSLILQGGNVSLYQTSSPHHHTDTDDSANLHLFQLSDSPGKISIGRETSQNLYENIDDRYLEGDFVTADDDVVSRSGKGRATPKAAAVGGDFAPQSRTEAVVTFFVTLLTFLLIVAVAVLLAKVVNGLEHMPDKLKKGYTAGIVLIPAWGWKDVVAAFMALCLYLEYLDENKPWTYVLFAFCNAVLCASFQLLIESLGKQFEPGTFIHSVITALMACYALGVGYGVDSAIRVCVGRDRFLQLKFTITYVLIMMAIVPEIQRQVSNRMDAETRAKYPVALVKGIDFLVQAGGFVLGWAFKGFFDTIFKEQMAMGVYWPGQMQVSISITLIGMLLSIIMSLLPVGQAYIDLTALVMGLNIGWTWMIFAGAVLAARGPSPSLAMMWFNSTVTLVIVVTVAMLTEYGVQHIEAVRILFFGQFRLLTVRLDGPADGSWSKIRADLMSRYGSTDTMEQGKMESDSK